MMRPALTTLFRKAFLRSALSATAWSALAFSMALLAGCNQLERPKVEPYYAVTQPPAKQELRWSNGKMPGSLDPARAAAAPETDVVRAIYEGLTTLDSKTLNEVPAVAKKWEANGDLRIWMFHLRKEARWSNGESITAEDFVRSWKRLGNLGEKAANRFLFENIVGLKAKELPQEKPLAEPNDYSGQLQTETERAKSLSRLDSEHLSGSQTPIPARPGPRKQDEPKPQTPKFGVEAIDDLTLKVTLEKPDKDFPKLVSSPAFLPVYGDGTNFEKTLIDQNIVTNGAFRISQIDDNGITLERSDNYWDKRSVALESVRFVASNTAESALEAYRSGAVDVVTNATFEPLAVKLLSPYEDFRHTAHSALNYYEFNTARPPFDDRRIREALTLAIDRDKLSKVDMEGTTQPANKFIPLGNLKGEALSFDVEKAKKLFEKAGYTDGQTIRPIRLVINRNDTQQRVARSVARMWKQNLNVDTDIIVTDPVEIESVRATGEFDLLRRGIVLPTTDEAVCLTAIFGSGKVLTAGDPQLSRAESSKTETSVPTLLYGENRDNELLKDPFVRQPENQGPISPPVATFTEQDALYELTAIPLYFPTSYSLLKPYVQGFDINGLDAPSLKAVTIRSDWLPKSTRGES